MRFSRRVVDGAYVIWTPTSADARRMLLDLQNRLGIGQRQFAAMMGSRRECVRRWLDGSRNPSRPARRLIYLFAKGYVSPDVFIKLPMPKKPSPPAPGTPPVVVEPDYQI